MATTKVIKIVYQFRRDTAANWLANKDVIPAAGEPCFVIDQNILKIGDGETTFENLPSIGGVDVSADGKSLILENSTFKLYGFDEAEIGAQPIKTEDGTIKWVVPSTETIDGLKTIVSDLQTDVSGLKTDVSGLKTSVSDIKEIITPSGEGEKTLIERIEGVESQLSGTGEGSVEQKIADEVTSQINDFATKVSDNGTVDTFKELVDYVSTHGTEAADMAADITELQGLVGSKSVGDQISDAIAASGHMDENKALAIFDKAKYEISHKPVSTLVDYRDKEIRVMCPVDTEFTLQNSGEGADKSVYYIGFKAYAPADAVSFKEDLKKTIEDPEMYYFEGNDFAGIDAYGRKYSIVWLPVARYDEATSTWTYYGKNSSAGKYIGWYYSVEWYDADGVKIASDTIRINLANEACFNSIVDPINGVSVGGTLLDAVGGKVNIPVGSDTLLGVVKASSEVGIAEDGALTIGSISIEKVVVPDEVELVMDGGASK